MRSLVILLPLAVSTTVIAQYPGANAPPTDLKKGFDTISVSDAKRVLTFLATKCDGRGTGQPGFEKAAEFIAKQFKSLGLKPLGDDGTYFQKTEFTRWRFDPATLKLKIEGNGVSIGGKDIILRSGPPTIEVKSQVVFVTMPSTRMDLEGKSFKGDLVILQTEKRSSYLESLILDAGADAVLSVVATRGEGSWHPRMGKNPPTVRPRLAGSISSEAAAKVLKALESAPKTESKTPSGIDVIAYSASVEFQESWP